MRAIDVARGPLIVVGPDSNPFHAARMMDVHQVDAVAVSDAGELIGILTERDLVVRGLARRLSDETQVTAVMTSHPVTVDGGAEAAAAYRLLREHRVHRLPVVTEGHLVGMLTLDDFAVEPEPELTRLVHTAARSGP
jgi:CBS domain-containing protein